MTKPDVLLRLEGVSKLYRLGEIGAGSFKEDLWRLWVRMLGRPDPLLSVSDLNKRDLSESEDYLWALRGISFDVCRGDSVALLGKNGAGKSTLLKILSRITKPTQGKVYLSASISSLLEVGTGFDLQLTGHDNIYLSGAILGMKRTQIQRHYADIVRFSGLARFLNTPIKRYSSGMVLRLGFAIAVHLQADVLILDEVLAVGDYEFRRRAVDKMGEISEQQNRTIIYVSHQLNTVKSICKRGILLEQGCVRAQGDIDSVLSAYMDSSDVEEHAIYEFEKPSNVSESKGYARRLVILNEEGSPCPEPRLGERIQIQVDFCLQQALQDVCVSLHIYTLAGVLVNSTQSKAVSLSAGDYSARFAMNEFNLGAGAYKLSIQMSTSLQVFENLRQVATLHISNITKHSRMQLIPEALVVTPMQVDIFENTYVR